MEKTKRGKKIVLVRGYTRKRRGGRHRTIRVKPHCRSTPE